LVLIARKPYYTFIEGHSYLTTEDLERIELKVGTRDISVEREFEKAFSNLVGTGDCVSYASGRMAFFEILRTLNLQPKDEVIILGFTCSVMADAIIRIGALPIFVDVDEETFLKSAENVVELLVKYKLVNFK
jgi:dTDP-4-amino-4,6-dideoxygalactose transaminase